MINEIHENKIDLHNIILNILIGLGIFFIISIMYFPDEVRIFLNQDSSLNFFDEIGISTVKKLLPDDKTNESKSYSNNIKLTLHKNIYDYFKNDAQRDIYYRGLDPLNSEELYYQMYSTNINDEYIIKNIVKQAKTDSIRFQNNHKGKSIESRTAERLVSFVQLIPYDYFSGKHYKYPYEVLYLNTGDCDEKSILLSKLLKELGYGVALFSFYDEEHMAVGIKCPLEKSNYYSGYCFIESTDVYTIGEIPEEYVGGGNMRTAIPSIIIINESGLSYNNLK